MASVSRFIKDPKTVAIIGCPFSGGQPKPGVDKGPIHLVQAGLPEQLRELGWNVHFDGHHQFEDVGAEYANSPTDAKERDPPIGKLKNPRLVSKVTESVAKAVGGHARKGELVLTLGGDHSLAMGTISGTLSTYPDAAIIWVDAHADVNTIETTHTGNIHGMPLAFLLGITSVPTSTVVNSETHIPFSWIPNSTVLDPSRLVYIGLRDVDSGEKAILKNYGIKAFSMHEVDRYGIGKVVEMALEWVNKGRNKEEGGRPIHLSFDVDALDPSVAPSTGTPVRGGLTFREGHYICEAIYETGCLVALDLVEVNPSLADTAAVQQTVAVGCSLVRSALGETLL